MYRTTSRKDFFFHLTATVQGRSSNATIPVSLLLRDKENRRYFKHCQERFMEMEERGCSKFYRNTNEEMFIMTMMESPIGMPAPTMEMLGFKIR